MLALQPSGSLGSVVGIATVLGSGWYGIRIPVMARGFSLLLVQGPTQHHSVGAKAISPFLKWLGYEVNHTSPSNAEDKNEWSYTSTLPICLLGVYWDNFTLYLYLLPQPGVWIICFLCKIEGLVLTRFMLLVVPRSLLYNGYQVFPRGKAAGAWR